MDGKAPLSDSEGPVLDPVVCIRHVVVLQPHETVQVDLVTGVAETREAVTALMEKYSRSAPGRPGLRAGLDAQPNLAAATQRQRGRCSGLRPAGGLDHLRLGAAPAKASVLIRNRRGQSGLWGYGISGRPADRARPHPRSRAHRTGAPGRAGARLLADERARRRSGDLERGRLGLPPDAAGRDHGPRRRQPGSGAGGQARRHLRAPRRADVGRGSDAACKPWPASSSLDDAGTLAEQVERRGRADVLDPRSASRRERRPEPRRRRRACPRATWRFSTAWAASAATAANMSCCSDPARPRLRRGST